MHFLRLSGCKITLLSGLNVHKNKNKFLKSMKICFHAVEQNSFNLYKNWNMYTVFEVEGRKGGAKSYVVKEINEVLQIDYQKEEEKEKIIFDKVTMHEGGVGRPYCNNVQVVVEVVRRLRKDKKIIVFKKKAKKRYEVKKGHRQLFTWIKIVGINKSAN